MALADHETIRGEPRFPLNLRVRVRLETWEQFEEMYTRNISRGGMFLSMAAPAPPGTQLRLEVALPDGRRVALRGQVAHTVSPETADSEGGRPGVGIRFLEPASDERAALDELLQQARGVAADGSSKLPAMPRDDEGEEAVVDALRGLLGELKQQTYFEVLGVPRDATRDDVRRGYLMQVKRWHPTRFSAQPASVRELAAEIFILIKHAFDDLSDPTRLELLRSRTRPRTQPPRNRLSTGDASQRSGDGSSELDFALRLAGEARYADARRVLTVALSHDPDNWDLREHYNMVSARAALADGDAEGALLHFHEALRVNPSNEEAVREIRGLVRLRRDARRRVLVRLFGGKTID